MSYKVVNLQMKTKHRNRKYENIHIDLKKNISGNVNDQIITKLLDKIEDYTVYKN